MATPAGPRNESRARADRADRRLPGALLVSLLLHALVLLLQFGVPGLGSPGAPAPLTVHLSQAEPSPLAPAVPVPPSPLPEMAIAPPARRPPSGMQLVDPVAAPPAPPAPPAVKARPKVRKDAPRRAKRISSPLVADTIDDSVRVIAQDMAVSEFNMPVAKPEEAEEKSVDAKDAQHGDDDGDAATTAALEEQEAIAGKKKEEDAEQARKLAERDEEEKREQERRAAAQLAQQEQQRLLEQQQLAQQKADLQKAELARQELVQVDQLKQQVQREQVARELVQREQVQREQVQREQVAQAEKQLAEKQRAELQRVEQQRVEQQRVAQQRAEQQRAEQQRAEQQRADQQRAEQQRAEQQRADQQRAGEQAARDAAQRSRDLAAQPGSGGAGSPAPGAGAGTGGAQIPKNMMGRDAATRARDMVRGLDLLRGDPPPSRLRDERRIAVGAGERDLPLKMYADSWRQKIERNASVNFPRSWADTMRIDPLVSVAVRSDGTVEDVTIVVSSGRADMDEAVRRIVRVNARYSPFPPQIAARYDVIEIRRVWRFDEQLRLLEEVR